MAEGERHVGWLLQALASDLWREQQLVRPCISNTCDLHASTAPCWGLKRSKDCQLHGCLSCSARASRAEVCSGKVAHQLTARSKAAAMLGILGIRSTGG